jgi:hypothetical protein
VAADRRKISFGLLGIHAVSITYRKGAGTRTEPVPPGLGAYLIVQRYTGGGRLVSITETNGRDAPGSYSSPAAPDGALTEITYRYAGRTCVDTGLRLRHASCGLSEAPVPGPTSLPVVHEPLRVRLRVHGHVITGAEISFRAPYPVTNAGEDYFVNSHTCPGLGGSGPDTDVARGEIVTIPLNTVLPEACPRSVRVTVEYTREVNGLTQPTPVGTVTVREPLGTHLERLRRRH